MTQNALAIYRDFDGLQRAAMALQKSGYFQDVKSEAQAIVKVMAGAELGLPPFASMSGIHIIQGKPTLGSNVMATLVKNDPRYDYRLKQCDEKACVLEWLEDGRKVGEAGFTIQEAQNAGLTTKDNWKKYTSDMLFARAISRGARRFAPGIFGGAPVYTPDEMGVDTDEEGYIQVDGSPAEQEETKQADENIQDGEFTDVYDQWQVQAQPKQSVTKQHPASPSIDPEERPWDAETLKAALEHNASNKGNYDASDKQRNLLGALLSEYFQDDDKRHTAQLWLLGAASVKDIDGPMVKVALDWLKPIQDDSGAYIIGDMAKHELSGVLAAALKAEGQDTLI